MAETAKALDYAHAQGVIHRDIKPANIMLLKDGKVKVTDFGIAKAVSDSQTKSGIGLGTPNYMSPEQINGQELDGRSDIFSVGVVFFELLTGQLPFHGKTLANLFYQITQGRHPSPRQVNPKVPKPCEQMIDKEIEVFEFRKTARHEATDAKTTCVWDYFGRGFIIHGERKPGPFDKEKRSIRFFSLYGEPLEQIERVPELSRFAFRPRPQVLEAKAKKKAGGKGGGKAGGKKKKGLGDDPLGADFEL